ncbi:EAL domain-containing protein (putative c-di-GMP-specific phosphodiesterase class I)/NO-binding membrane sensor protein with MHYT domain [Alkalibacillus flavidus]|uniref:EAL domain-containing protein (Putative c-di-GMP-specific phosphodiesterase class I)/NO-binding membrane sensor protein with MHYT domain n=1 Tax=Alkalibacillus flavidus TaxID=546021 RepID=A0ABV2KWG1_9BACI
MDVMDFHLIMTVTVKGTYDLFLVSLSIVIAIIAAYAALSLNERLYHSGLIHPYFWIGLASLTMGVGIWSMHFIGMSAYQLNVPMTYDTAITILSVAPAVIALLIAFWMVYYRKRKFRHIVLASMLIGIGIATMHFTGMEAMVVANATMQYHAGFVILSVLVAIVIAFIALLILINQPDKMPFWSKMIIAILLGLGVSSMHYTGMYATTFEMNESLVGKYEAKGPMGILIASITMGILGIVLFSMFSTIFDRQLKRRLELYDPLTNLPNRKVFNQQIAQYKSMNEVGLAIVHLHDLDTINNKYSYQQGDETIKILVELVKQAYRKHFSRREFLVYRISNQKIGIVVNEYSIVKKMQHFSSDLIHLCQSENMAGLNISVALAAKPKTAKQTIELIDQAYAVINMHGEELINDYAMFKDKTHKEGLRDKLIERLRLIEYDEEFVVKYQPKISNIHHDFVGVEALIRWNDDQLGFIPPNQFIPVAEKTGEIHPITIWLIEHVCKQIKEWQVAGFNVGKVAINLSNRTLTEDTFVVDVENIINRYQVDPSLLEFEITESSIIDDEKIALMTVKSLRELGATIALDDFGTGFSSLTYLRKLPIDKMKIDKSFLDGIVEDSLAQQFLADVINLGSTLSLGVVVEGVENEEELNIIGQTSADEIQGFYFGKPMSSDELISWDTSYNEKILN